MHQGPPTWIYFISPFVSILAVILAYLLGNMQGQAQTRYNRATDALTRILALALEAEDYLLTLRSFRGLDSPVAEWSEAVIRTESQLADVYRSSRPWLSPEQRKHVDDVTSAFGPIIALLVSDRDMPAMTGMRVDATSLANVLDSLDIGTSIGSLDDEVTRLASSPSVVQRLWDRFLDWVAQRVYPNSRYFKVSDNYVLGN